MSATNSATLNVTSNGGDSNVYVDQSINQSGPASYGDASNTVNGTVTANGGDANVSVKQSIDQQGGYKPPCWPPFPKPEFHHGKKPWLL